MQIKDEMKQRVLEMEVVTKAFNIEPFDIYFLGGSACIIGDYNDRMTRDFDFIDLDYSSKLGKVFSVLRDYDMLEYRSTVLSPNYKERATKLNDFKYLNVHILSREDIIVSKIIRLEKKDIEDINVLIKSADIELIKKIITEVLQRKDLFISKKQLFLKKLNIFKELYNV